MSGIFAPALAIEEPHTIQGHPTVALLDLQGEVIQMITVCGECGAVKSVIVLVGDKWYCAKCRSEGSVHDTKMFPIS